MYKFHFVMATIFCGQHGHLSPSFMLDFLNFDQTPLLILANKADLKDAVPAAEIHLNLGLDLIRLTAVVDQTPGKITETGIGTLCPPAH